MPDELLVLEGSGGLAIGVAAEIYAKFGWNDPPLDKLAEEQSRF